MKLCAIDFESNGLNIYEARITEVGAYLVQVMQVAEGHPAKLITPHKGVSRLVYDETYPKQSDKILEITGITDEMLKNEGCPFHTVVAELLTEFSVHGWPDFFVAHNKSFDEGIFKAEMKRHKDKLLEVLKYEDLDRLYDIPWICSIKDIEHPEQYKCRKLSHLALDYGVTVDPTKLHRALDDVGLLVELLTKASLDWSRLKERIKIPWCIVKANVPHPKKDNGAGKDKAKACGFSWEQIPGMDKKFSLSWVKQIRESDLLQEAEKLGYEVILLERS